MWQKNLSGFKIKNAFLIFLFINVVSRQTVSMETINAADGAEFAKKSQLFAMNMYNQLVLQEPQKNIVFSPFSIQTCAAMARVGAENETAEELDRGLCLTSNNIDTMTDGFQQILKSYEQSNILRMANKIYVKKGYALEKTFNDIMIKKFYTTAEELEFVKSVEAAATINQWVESKTNNLIKDLVSPDNFDGDTLLVLLNAIHFKGMWRTKFDAKRTHDQDFYLNDEETVRVPMMHVKSRFQYANLRDLDASALEMPYENSDLSMLVILPRARTGLKSLEEKLKQVSLDDIVNKLHEVEVMVTFPKFKTEFSMELNDAFKALGMSRMFSEQAEFGKMLEKEKEIKVSKVIHKAFIEVNEEGTEAAAATGFEIKFYSACISRKPPVQFIADRPFFYGIRNKAHALLFSGNFKKVT